MTTLDRFDDVVARWLMDNGPADIRPAALEAALELAARKAQQRGLWALVRPQALRAARLAIVLALVAGAIGMAIYVASTRQHAPAPIRLTSTEVLPQAGNRYPIGLADGRVLLIGLGTAGGATAIYDPNAGSLVSTGSLHVPRGIATLAVRLRDGRVLVAGGFTSTDGESHYQTSAELYDPATGVWQNTGSMTQQHEDCCGDLGLDANPSIEAQAVVLHDGRVLVVGGSAMAADLFDPGSGSFAAASIGCRPRGDVQVLRDGRALVTCYSYSNWRDPSAPPPSLSLKLFDPASNTFSDAATPPGSSAAQLSLLPDGRVLLAGWVLQADQWAHVYDPVHDRYDTLLTDTNPRAGGWDFTLVDGRVVYVPRQGGYVTVFDPATMRFTADPAFTPSTIGRMTVLADGRIFAVGDGAQGEHAWVITPEPGIRSEFNP